MQSSGKPESEISGCQERIGMKITLNKKEWQDFAIEALRAKYSSLIPQGMEVYVDIGYMDTVITFSPKEEEPNEVPV